MVEFIDRKDVRVVSPTDYMKSTGGTISTVGTVSLLSGTVVAGAGANIIGAVKRDIVNYTKFHKEGRYTAAQTAAIVWDPTAGKKFVMTDFIISTSTHATISIADGTSTIGQWYFDNHGGLVSNLQTPYQSIAADNNLTIKTSASTASIQVFGYEV